MTSPLVSFVVTVHNRKELLPACLDSILAEGSAECEIVIVDDGSTDGAEHVYGEYACRHPRVRFRRFAENKGPGFARNAGAELARGRFLFFVDSDDTVDTASLPELFAVLRADPGVDIVSFNCTNVLPTGERKAKQWIRDASRHAAGEFLERYSYQLAMPMWAFLYNRDFLSRNELAVPETFNMEDMCFTTHALLTAATIRTLPDNLYNYHMRESGTLASIGDYSRNLAGFAACCRMLAGLPDACRRMPCFMYAFRKFIINMLMIPAPCVAAGVIGAERGDEPGIGDFRPDDPEALIAAWAAYFCRAVRDAAASTGKKAFFAPAFKAAVPMANLLRNAGVPVAGFLDNNAAAANPNAEACRREGFDVLPFASAAEHKTWLPVLFCYEGYVSCILERQLSAMGLARGMDFLAVYDFSASAFRRIDRGLVQR